MYIYAYWTMVPLEKNRVDTYINILCFFIFKKYILLTKHERRTGRISARGLDSTDQVQRGPYIKDRGRYSPSMVPSKLG